jgi:hypothetical protein
MKGYKNTINKTSPVKKYSLTPKTTFLVTRSWLETSRNREKNIKTKNLGTISI